jgi:hypothetical protein
LVVVFTGALSDNDALYELIESHIVPAARSSRALLRHGATGIQNPMGGN